MTTTIDMTAMSAKHTSAESDSRTRRRRWAQTRLQAYGILALILAAAALVILLSSIVAKATTVLYERYLVMEVQVGDISERDMERLRDPDPQARAALSGNVRDAMLEEVGGREAIERSEARQLFGLLSTDAGLELGVLVKQSIQEGRSVVGETVRFEALLDDQVQMYLKGTFGTLEPGGTDGTLRIETVPEAGRVRLDFPGSALEPARQALRSARLAQADRAEAEAARQQAAVASMRAQLIDAEQDDVAADTLERLRERRAGYEAARDEALERARALTAKANDRDAVFALAPGDPSVMVRVRGGGWVKIDELGPESARGRVVEPLRSDSASFGEGSWEAWLYAVPETNRQLSDRQVIWLNDFDRENEIVERFNWRLLESSDSSNAELAGIWGALVGSFWTMVVTFVLAFPIGVMASIYLEEFAPKNRFTDFIEININNLAAVPSIVFGLLGITVLISGVSLFGVDLFDGLLRSITEDPRSTPLAGGVVLALMSLPTIIIAGRASIKAVPPSIRDAALGLGASRLQTATHHVLPLAMPGILTGSIIAMAQALGETAPLIIIGMNSFIQEAPGTPFDKSNVLPSLVYLWNGNSERLFDGKTAMAILVLLSFLIAMNALAVILRRQFERRW